ncbi:exosome 3'-_5 exonuclease subunit ski4 (Csl4) [Chamberlinius hualienensis]
MSKTLISVVPGQKICKSDEQHVPGKGTFIRHGFIYSCLLGHLVIESKDSQILTIEVRRGLDENAIVPTAGSIVTAKVTSINQRYCKCAIICIKDLILREPFHGLIRKEDVRATEKDSVEMYKCFRPGDIVLARVLSLGDAFSYLLSTAEDELGVAVAQSESGTEMIPISWTEMQCPKTSAKEFRKVAKVLPSNAILRSSVEN